MHELNDAFCRDLAAMEAQGRLKVLLLQLAHADQGVQRQVGRLVLLQGDEHVACHVWLELLISKPAMKVDLALSIAVLDRSKGAVPKMQRIQQKRFGWLRERCRSSKGAHR